MKVAHTRRRILSIAGLLGFSPTLEFNVGSVFSAVQRTTVLDGVSRIGAFCFVNRAKRLPGSAGVACPVPEYASRGPTVFIGQDITMEFDNYKLRAGTLSDLSC
jgi:hypothetical protein